VTLALLSAPAFAQGMQPAQSPQPAKPAPAAGAPAKPATTGAASRQDQPQHCDGSRARQAAAHRSSPLQGDHRGPHEGEVQGLGRFRRAQSRSRRCRSRDEGRRQLLKRCSRLVARLKAPLRALSFPERAAKRAASHIRLASPSAGAQPAKPPPSRKACSSGFVARPNSALRCGKRPKRRMISA
jgi:hypothetical protein